MLRLPELHDGFFDGVWLSEQDSARLFFRTKHGERFTLLLEGVVGMHVDNLRAGNIVLDVEYVPPERISLEHICSAHPDAATNPNVMGKLLSGAQQSGVFALLVNTSYGAEGSFLFKAGSVVPNHVLETKTK